MYAQFNSISSIIFRYEAPVKIIEVISTQEKNILVD